MSNLFNEINQALAPKVAQMTHKRKLYTFAKERVPMNREELETTTIETVIATSFDECFKERPDLATWHYVSVTP
jgi:hypothetical protein